MHHSKCPPVTYNLCVTVQCSPVTDSLCVTVQCSPMTDSGTVFPNDG